MLGHTHYQRTVPACTLAKAAGSMDGLQGQRRGSMCSCSSDSCPSQKKMVARGQSAEHPARVLSTATLLLTGVASPCIAEIMQHAVSTYTPQPYNPGWEIWVGAAAGAIPFAIGSWEFGKRILIQRRCERCQGNGLVQKGRYFRKCPDCGGFFPWQGWGKFFTSTAAPGNGGVLRAPKGQTSVFYKVPDRKQPENNSREISSEINEISDSAPSTLHNKQEVSEDQEPVKKQHSAGK